MNKAVEQATVIALAIIGLAILAVLVSNNAKTVPVIGAISDAFNGALAAATGPVTGTGGFGSIAPLHG